VAIAIHTPADSGSTPDRPIAIVPVARLRHALSTIRKTMPKPRGRSVRPIPQLVTIQGGIITAGDSHNAGVVTIPVDRDVIHDDAYVIPLDALVAAAKGAKGSIAIYADRIMRADGTSITFTVDSDHAEAAAVEADYVNAPMPPRMFTLTGQQWCDLANIVGSHASTDDTRPVLTGIYVSPVAEDGTVDLVATDSWRLAITSVQTGHPQTYTHCLIPSRMISVIAAHIAKHPHASVEVHPDADSVTIRAVDQDPEGDPGECYTLIGARSRMISGQYPNYRKLIPDGPNRSVTLADDACDRISTFARMRRTNTPMRITVEDSTLAVEWEGAELTVPCHVEGEQDPITFALNAAFAADCLAAMPQGGATIGIINPLRPFTFTAADPSQDYYNVTSVVMPMRVSA
jgi:DNA polymerase III sliding clamp (beta) subunit (PCNA family)